MLHDHLLFTRVCEMPSLLQAYLVTLLSVSVALILIVASTFARKSCCTKRPSVVNSLRCSTISSIPKVIIQTVSDKTRVPDKVNKNIAEYAPNYERIVYNDDECVQLIRHFYGEEFVSVFHRLSGAHRADLFRYCYLYRFGGIYMDIKMELVRPMDDILSVLARNRAELASVLSIVPQTIFQGFIAIVPKHSLMLSLLKLVRDRADLARHDYLIFTRDFYTQLTHTCKPQEGKCRGDNVFLFKELCESNGSNCVDGLDRYQLCCNVTLNGERYIKTRYADYPW